MLKSKSFALFMSLAALSLGVRAETYPSKPIMLVVPFAAGGTVNMMGRLVAEHMGKQLGQPVVVDNKAGAGGAIGAGFVAKATPDGYTLLLGSMGQAVQPLLTKRLPYDPKKLVPVALFATVSNVLAVSSNAPAKNVSDLVGYSKANPGKLNMASAGIGSINQLIGELFMSRTGANFVHVPYKGAGPAGVDLLSGQVQLIFANLPNVLPYARAGKVRLLAVASEKRDPAIPDVPTFAEAGVKDAVVESWYGLMAPAGTKPEVIKKLQDTLLVVTKDKRFISQLAEQGARPYPGSSADMTRLMEKEGKRWGEVIEHAKISLD
ncbi:Bug family tripartite tricarboxylate transporter substrate binding protein [Cupriavidus metallidurans]|uniref:Bug family tripartite tricarboxylate transporter substrate binding protein n=1 Tax=Cupriavidus metallidurans TaxID=119219 RepID=UPI001CCB1A91|nr:tripartite tricarboxylate transporter substrate binding protein [Cupriavidus metallidurans]UBM07674.1 tripartite tricarboxylate transporter substrate binding protein [Cupriavidus metallidurans]